MTARQYAPGTVLNKSGTGRGMKTVNSPVTKKRGASKLRPASDARKHTDTSTIANAALVDVNKPLTEKQKLFVKFWAEGDSIPNASVRAGYGDGATFAYRMTKMPNVLAIYNKVKRQYEEAAQMTKKKVMDMLLESYEMAKLMAEPATMVSAAREVGKMCGYYEPKKVDVNVNVRGSVTMQQLSGMSDADLLKVIEDGVRAEAEAEFAALEDKTDEATSDEG